jgi:hypothetical protein
MSLADKSDRQLIKIAHTAKRQRFDDDEVRKDFLRSRFDKESFAEMNRSELIQFINYCNGGYNSFINAGVGKGTTGPTEKQHKLIHGMRRKLAMSEEHLYNLVKEKTDKKYWDMSAKDVTQVIAVLNREHRRVHGCYYTDRP